MISQKIVDQWKKDEKAFFEGWDFSYLKSRYKLANPSWNYKTLAKRLIKKSCSVLDIATGGGEVFSEILSIYKPQKIIAIEGYKPNITVARKNLKKFKATVIYANETKKFHFKDSEFDLILNRHGGLNKKSIKELYRILSPKGIFLTQQVDGNSLKDLEKVFNAKPKWPENNMQNIKKFCTNTGFKIKEAKEWEGKTIFKDVGAVIYFLKAIPWIVSGFSVNRYLKVLEKLQKRIEKKGELNFKSKFFLILAQK